MASCRAAGKHENMVHDGTWDMGHGVHHQLQVHEDVYQRPGDGDQSRHQARTGG